MRHCRTDYEAIQPWPTTRPHTVKQDGELLFDAPIYRGTPPYKPIIPDDEPVFVLRSRDVNGPDAVRFWADATERAGGDPVTTARVRRWADEMEWWGDANGTKVPDTPAELLRP